MRRTKTKRQLHCAEALRLVKRLRDDKQIYDPKLLRLFVKRYFVERAPELNLNLVSLDQICGGVMSMLANEDKKKRAAKEYGYENLMTIYALEDQTLAAQRAAHMMETTSVDQAQIDWNDVENAKKALEAKGGISSELDEEPDFTEILKSRATDDIAQSAQSVDEDTSIDAALADFEELDKKGE